MAEEDEQAGRGRSQPLKHFPPRLYRRKRGRQGREGEPVNQRVRASKHGSQSSKESLMHAVWRGETRDTRRKKKRRNRKSS
ncbi:hypothetical protein CgunFtcFv8_003412 [Champsocephalus gunnari]|uniref:Uncharacterized protein n=1 Tax=Champsocephalus gunnari TaxID=52237 RepID=A0AAN8HNX3_CHAGU|nr:hypothetical protein CgunFtcFv8_003412 [Champsocephalus gunnari]